MQQPQAVARRALFDERRVLAVVTVAGAGQLFKALRNFVNHARLECGKGRLDQIGAVEMPKSALVRQQRDGCGIQIFRVGQLT